MTTVVVGSSQTTAVITDSGMTVQITDVAIGPAGPAGGASTLTLTAPGAIGGHRAVVPNGDGTLAYADSQNPAHFGKVVGFTLNAGSVGDPVSVAVSGEVTEPSWAWVPGEVYLGSNGLLTQTAPTTGFVQVMGIATTPTRMVVGLRAPILLS